MLFFGSEISLSEEKLVKKVVKTRNAEDFASESPDMTLVKKPAPPEKIYVKNKLIH